MFSSYFAAKFEVKPENILLACKKRFVEEHIDNTLISPIKPDLWDEKKRQFCFDILKVLRKFPAVSYDQDTQKIVDSETGLSLPIDHFLTKYTTEQIQQQYGEIITKWIKQAHYTKHCADDLDRLRNEIFPSRPGYIQYVRGKTYRGGSELVWLSAIHGTLRKSKRKWSTQSNRIADNTHPWNEDKEVEDIM